LQSPPDDDGVWSGPKVAQVIAEVTGVAKVWPQRGWDYLKRLEQSLQVPRPRHCKGDAEAQEAFKKTPGAQG
jgi:transposase